jgi:hypothetical protein
MPGLGELSHLTYLSLNNSVLEDYRKKTNEYGRMVGDGKLKERSSKTSMLVTLKICHSQTLLLILFCLQT